MITLIVTAPGVPCPAPESRPGEGGRAAGKRSWPSRCYGYIQRIPPPGQRADNQASVNSTEQAETNDDGSVEGRN